MLNATCQIEEEFIITSVHYVTSFLSIPIYGIAFLILLMKCPKHFNEYRKYLLVHIVSGFLLDFHIGVIWKVVVHLPWTAMCSAGLASEYAVHCFQVLCALLIFTGITTLSLFIYRMKAATKYVEHASLQKIVIILKHAFLVCSCFVCLLTIAIYPDLKSQKRYKEKMNDVVGSLPGYMWCDNCYFMQFDSWIFVVFYAVAYCTVMCAFLSGGLAAIETIMSLNSKSLRLSAKTVAIQKNFLFSLVEGIVVHITLIFIPLAVYFVANIFIIDIPYLAPFLIIMLQDHGSVSTLTMIVTNNVLRRAMKKLLSNPESILCGTEPTMVRQMNIGMHILANNAST